MDMEVGNRKGGWPLRPVETALALHGLCMLLTDIAQRDLDSAAPMPRRLLLQMSGVTAATEVFAAELAHWFSTRPEQDHDLLEALQDRYMAGS